MSQEYELSLANPLSVFLNDGTCRRVCSERHEWTRSHASGRGCSVGFGLGAVSLRRVKLCETAEIECRLPVIRAHATGFH